MEPTSQTTSATSALSTLCENLPEAASEAEKPPVAFGLTVRKEVVNENASVRKRSADALADHDNCLPQTLTETAPKRKKTQYVLIPVTIVKLVQAESQQQQEAAMPLSCAVRDESLSSSLDSFPESYANPFDAAFKAAQSEAREELENPVSDTEALLEFRYDPIRKSPEQQKREHTLFNLTTRV